MPTTRGSETEELWRRVGLEELRRALNRVEGLLGNFTRTLRALPPCDTCARATLLEQIRVTGHQLGREAVSLAVLAETLKTAVAAAEQTQQELLTDAPEPCQCSRGPCTCHT